MKLERHLLFILKKCEFHINVGKIRGISDFFSLRQEVLIACNNHVENR